MSSGDGARNNPPEASGAAKAGSRKKIRPTYSCLNCHKRKVKCDRVKPCGACCLRGTPSECEYGTSKRDRHYIQQSALIENLLRSCENLKQQLAEARQLANLPAIKDEDGSLPSSQALYSIKESDNSVDDGDDSLDELDLSSKAADNQSLASPNAVALEEQRTRKETNALIEFYVERLVNDFSPTQVSGTIALREARSLRVFSPILCSAFEAASLTFAGRRDGNRSVEVAGHSRYLRVLRSLQHALYDPQQGKSTEVLVVVLLATIIEAFKQTSKDSLLKHQLGGLELLRTRTPYRHRHGIERSLYVDLRMYWVTAALVHRKPTFLAEKDWLTVPWPGDGPAKDILQRLLDVAVHIPGYLAQVDEFSALLKGGDKPPSELVNMQSAIWERATELQGLLQVWKNMYADTYPSGGPWEESPSEADPTDDFPKFRCRNPSTMQVIVGQNIMYPDLLLATSMTFYWALGLIISTTDPGLVSVLGLQERYQYACNICRSMKYYTQNIPGCLISRVMFILRTAFDNFADGMIEKESMAEIFTYIGRKFELPVFSNKCTSSSVKGEGKP
ncbi:Zn(II)2Cys6 transcription factor domain-containing protein [Aspergillus vadensis CBS 113365]|uniref:C6 finger domain protein n=1 Tax=Aspergillus vadensis (strain CBS 113365 / IMI 142717 / IBT 24658) TaxID=1448311 RepID=A0A319C4S7_ASPVC|nr:C6 finger domain protein [Aspergillus vadensis CBS 113365]PYH73313.1 C6 finger domain protein [Aspergillus vadensis CBS 113365]